MSLAAIYVEKQPAVHAMLFSEEQSTYPIGVAEAITAAQEQLRAAGEWDLLPTKEMLVLRDTMLEEASVLAYRDCYLAIAISSLFSVALTFFLRVPKPRR